MSVIVMSEPFYRARSHGRMPNVLLSLSLCLALGLLVQGLVLLAMAAQDTLPQTPRLLADAVRLLVLCAGTGLVLTVAVAVAKTRGALAAVIALLGAPLAFLLARSAQITTLGAVTGADIHGATPWLAAALHGLAFGLLAVLLPVLARRGAGVLAYASTGAALGGLAFGIGLALLPTAGDLLPRAIAEIGVAGGIAAIVFLVSRIGRRKA